MEHKPMICMMTQSTCYKGTRTFTPQGVLWHSTGANNPNLMRYVQPDDRASNRKNMLDILGTNPYKNDWNHIQRTAGVNAWIGKLKNGSITTVQVMPWSYRPWGCGSGIKGSCNNTHIQFEICEDGLEDEKYFKAIYQEACELTAYLCKIYGFDPKGMINMNDINIPVILDHVGASNLSLSSNHADIQHWFTRFGKTMDNVREDVAQLLSSDRDRNVFIPTPQIPPSEISEVQNEDFIIISDLQPFQKQTSVLDVFMSPIHKKYIKSTTGIHYISNSGSDERGKYSGGEAGDQTGKEWTLRTWFNRPWTHVLRYPDQRVALRIAELGIDAALNEHIGYDQGERTTYWGQLQISGYEPSRINENCEADCSTGVCSNVRAVGFLMDINPLKNLKATYTGDMLQGFKTAGFQVFTDKKHLTQSDYLLPGDILLNVGHHTATNITIGKQMKNQWYPSEADEISERNESFLIWDWLNRP